MPEPLSIALAQINPIVGDLSYNRDKIIHYWQKADERGADLVVFPELVVCGYPPEDLIFKSDFLDEVEKQIKMLVSKSEEIGCGIIVSAPYRVQNSKGKVHWDIPHEEQIHDAAFLIHESNVDVVLKHHMATYGIFDEHRIFVPGPMPEPVDFKKRKLGILVCEDLWHGDVETHLQKQGAEVLIVPNGSPFTKEKHNVRLRHSRNVCKKTGLPLFYVNQVGGQDEIVFDGGSFAIDAEGKTIVQMPFFEEDLGFPGDDDNVPHMSESAEIYNALKLGIKDYVIKNGFPGVVIGLSGGVDSALTAVLAVDALGADKVHCVMMPSRYTSQESMEDANALAQNLNVSCETIPIESPLKAFEGTIPDLKDLAHENIQARIRGNILMALSNMRGHMVLSTGNKSEMAVGYATLYGDMNGGFNALKDVYKTQIYDLCRWRNEQSPIIPEHIISKAPSAELKENQKDQDSLPPYDILDGILKMLIEKEFGLEECVAAGYDEDMVLKVWKMIDRAEYKRRQACPGVKITTKAFGRDRRYPITNHFFNSISG